MSIAQGRLRDYEARLGIEFAHTAYLKALATVEETATPRIRNRAQALQEPPAPQPEPASPPTAQDIAHPEPPHIPQMQQQLPIAAQAVTHPVEPPAYQSLKPKVLVRRLSLF